MWLARVGLAEELAEEDAHASRQFALELAHPGEVTVERLDGGVELASDPLCGDETELALDGDFKDCSRHVVVCELYL